MRAHIGYQREGQITQPIRKFKYYVRMLELEKTISDEQKMAEQLNEEFNGDDHPVFIKKSVHDDLVYIKNRISEQMA